MFELDWVEVVGYAASALVVIALTMTSVVRLRIFSLCGSVTFFVYGALIDSVPIMITNGSIACINVWYLRKEFAPGRSGVGLGVSHIRNDSPFLHDFIEYHLDDIHRFQPDFEMPSGDRTITLLMTRDSLPAGMVVGRRMGTTLHIDLDYVLAPYRDSRLGKWVYGQGADVFRRDGFTTLQATGTTDTHRRYLERMGFRPTPGAPDLHQLDL